MKYLIFSILVFSIKAAAVDLAVESTSLDEIPIESRALRTDIQAAGMTAPKFCLLSSSDGFPVNVKGVLSSGASGSATGVAK